MQAKTEVELLKLLNEKDPTDQWCIVRLLSRFSHLGHTCLVFEHLSFNLYDLLRKTHFNGVSLNLIRKFARQILKTLAFLSLEEVNVIHCDLKPENILFRQPNRSAIKVIDFGSSCRASRTMYTYIQSRFYRSPEVILGLPYSQPIDMWSLGCMLVEMHTGSPLFSGRDQHDQMIRFCQLKGLPPRHMLQRGRKTREFFDIVQPSGSDSSMSSSSDGEYDSDSGSSVGSSGSRSSFTSSSSGSGDESSIDGARPARPDASGEKVVAGSKSAAADDSGMVVDATSAAGAGKADAAGDKRSRRRGGDASAGERRRHRRHHRHQGSLGSHSTRSQSPGTSATPESSHSRRHRGRRRRRRHWLSARSEHKPIFRLKTRTRASSSSHREPTIHKNLASVLGVNIGGPGGRRRSETTGHTEHHYRSFLDLVESMLEYDPAVRIRPMQALNHPFLRDEVQSSTVAPSSMAGAGDTGGNPGSGGAGSAAVGAKPADRSKGAEESKASATTGGEKAPVSGGAGAEKAGSTGGADGSTALAGGTTGGAPSSSDGAAASAAGAAAGDQPTAPVGISRSQSHGDVYRYGTAHAQQSGNPFPYGLPFAYPPAAGAAGAAGFPMLPPGYGLYGFSPAAAAIAALTQAGLAPPPGVDPFGTAGGPPTGAAAAGVARDGKAKRKSSKGVGRRARSLSDDDTPNYVADFRAEALLRRMHSSGTTGVPPTGTAPAGAAADDPMGAPTLQRSHTYAHPAGVSHQAQAQAQFFAQLIAMGMSPYAAPPADAAGGGAASSGNAGAAFPFGFPPYPLAFPYTPYFPGGPIPPASVAGSASASAAAAASLATSGPGSGAGVHTHSTDAATTASPGDGVPRPVSHPVFEGGASQAHVLHAYAAQARATAVAAAAASTGDPDGGMVVDSTSAAPAAAQSGAGEAGAAGDDGGLASNQASEPRSPPKRKGSGSKRGLEVDSSGEGGDDTEAGSSSRRRQGSPSTTATAGGAGFPPGAALPGMPGAAGLLGIPHPRSHSTPPYAHIAQATAATGDRGLPAGGAAPALPDPRALDPATNPQLAAYLALLYSYGFNPRAAPYGLLPPLQHLPAGSGAAAAAAAAQAAAAQAAAAAGAGADAQRGRARARAETAPESRDPTAP